jgi:hypothetical protein
MPDRRTTVDDDDFNIEAIRSAYVAEGTRLTWQKRDEDFRCFMTERDAMIRRGERERCEAIVEALAREYEDHDGYANRDPRGWSIGETIRNSWKRLSGSTSIHPGSEEES